MYKGYPVGYHCVDKGMLETSVAFYLEREREREREYRNTLFLGY